MGEQENKQIFTIEILAKRWNLSIKKVITKLCVEYRRDIHAWLKGEAIITGHAGKPNTNIYAIDNDMTYIRCANITLSNISQKTCGAFERIQCKLLLQAIGSLSVKNNHIAINELKTRTIGLITEYETLITRTNVSLDKIFCFAEDIIHFEKRCGIKSKPIKSIALNSLESPQISVTDNDCHNPYLPDNLTTIAPKETNAMPSESDFYTQQSQENDLFSSLGKKGGKKSKLKIELCALAANEISQGRGYTAFKKMLEDEYPEQSMYEGIDDCYDIYLDGKSMYYTTSEKDKSVKTHIKIKSLQRYFTLTNKASDSNRTSRVINSPPLES